MSKHKSVPSKDFSGGGKKHQPQHHKGHSHGHPTEHGLHEVAGVGNFHSADSGTAAEHGLSAGDHECVAHALPETHSILENHELQHVDYHHITGGHHNKGH